MVNVFTWWWAQCWSIKACNICVVCYGVVTTHRQIAHGLPVWRIFNRGFENFDILLKNATEIGVVRKLWPVHICVVCHAITTACGQIEHIEINYDAHTDAVRLRTNTTHAVDQYDTFSVGFFKLLIFYWKMQQKL